MIIVDASVLANALGDDGGEGERARAALAGHEHLVAPDLVDVETVAVWRKGWLRKTLSVERFATALAHLQELDLERVATRGLVRRSFELRANVSAYDACYVALAEVLGCELVTADARLAAASGPRCPIRVVA